MTIFPQWIAPALLCLISIAWLFTWYYAATRDRPKKRVRCYDLHEKTEQILDDWVAHGWRAASGQDIAQHIFDLDKTLTCSERENVGLRNELRIVEEELQQERADNGQFGVGA